MDDFHSGSTVISQAEWIGGIRPIGGVTRSFRDPRGAPAVSRLQIRDCAPKMARRFVATGGKPTLDPPGRSLGED
jgi:hypothetical protein